MADDDIWLPLVEEPIGEFVASLHEEDEELAAMVASPRRQLAFRTFAYIRVGILLGSLLVDHDVQPEGSRTWVDELLADPKLAEEEPVGPDDDARERFRRFARDLG